LRTSGSNLKQQRKEERMGGCIIYAQKREKKLCSNRSTSHGRGGGVFWPFLRKGGGGSRSLRVARMAWEKGRGGGFFHEGKGGGGSSSGLRSLTLGSGGLRTQGGGKRKTLVFCREVPKEKKEPPPGACLNRFGKGEINSLKGGKYFLNDPASHQEGGEKEKKTARGEKILAVDEPD